MQLAAAAMVAAAAPCAQAGSAPLLGPIAPGSSTTATAGTSGAGALVSLAPTLTAPLKLTPAPRFSVPPGAAPTTAAAATRFPDLRDMNLALTPPAIRAAGAVDVTDPTALPNDRAAVPLPSPAATGLLALAVLGLVGSRKAILRFLS
jgi:hypothetical protein